MNTQKRCAACGQLFTLQHPAAKYCGPSCKGQPQAAPMETRTWNGHPIQRRPDGYINATAMAKAAGRHLPHYWVNSRAREYLQALEGSVGIPTDFLIQSVVTGPNHLRGTYVHPRLAIDIARWASPAFAVWVDGWVLEHLQGAPRPMTKEPVLPELPTPLDRRLQRMDHLYQWARRLVITQHPEDSNGRFNYFGRFILQDVCISLMIEIHGQELVSAETLKSRFG
jgi:hypothetical protein